jgi:hypothetical protein
MSRHWTLCAAIATILVAPGPIFAQLPLAPERTILVDAPSKIDGQQPDEKNGNAKEDKKEAPKHIRDNGFFVEEAVNQEPGEVQHIFNWINFWDRAEGVRTRNFFATYTMELPLGTQKHQFSFTTQFLTEVERPDFGPTRQRGDIGDTFLNYRYQLLADDDFLWCAPRFSLILPTGDRDLRLGTGELGYQFNLPISRYGKDFDFHFNAGFTYQPNVSLPLDVTTAPLIFSPRHDLVSYFLGAAVYWKPKTDLHFFVETVSFWNADIDEVGRRDLATQVLVNPGVRWAVIQEPVAWVLGVAAPIGLTRDAPDIGVFFYMSVEHPFRKKADSATD